MLIVEMQKPGCHGLFVPNLKPILMNVCDSFRRNPNGSWTSVAAVTIQGPAGQVQIGPGMTFTRGVIFMGLDLAAWLDENCI